MLLEKTIAKSATTVEKWSNYTAFGSPMPGRKFAGSNSYRYGFNGKENDNETVGTGSGTQDYGLRIYNPALGKFLSVDPLAKDFPWNSCYAFAENSPILNLDLDGGEKDPYWVHLLNSKGNTAIALATYGTDVVFDNIGIYKMGDGMMEIADAGRDNAVQTGFTAFVPKETRTIITEERIRRGENQAIEGAMEFADACNEGIAIAGAYGVFATGNITYMSGDKKVNLANSISKTKASSSEGVNVSGQKKLVNYDKTRPTFRKGVVEKTWENAKSADGVVKDPNTGKVLTWDKSKSRADQWHMGHVKGQEYRKLLSDYKTGKISPQEFLDEYNNVKNYKPEDPKSNMSHEHEQK